MKCYLIFLLLLGMITNTKLCIFSVLQCLFKLTDQKCVLNLQMSLLWEGNRRSSSLNTSFSDLPFHRFTMATTSRAVNFIQEVVTSWWTVQVTPVNYWEEESQKLRTMAGLSSKYQTCSFWMEVTIDVLCWGLKTTSTVTTTLRSQVTTLMVFMNGILKIFVAITSSVYSNSRQKQKLHHCAKQHFSEFMFEKEKSEFICSYKLTKQLWYSCILQMLQVTTVSLSLQCQQPSQPPTPRHHSQAPLDLL